MALNFTTIFTNLGVIAGTLENAHQWSSGTGGGTFRLQASLNDIETTLLANGCPSQLIGALMNNELAYRSAVSASLGAGLRTLFQSYFRFVINESHPQPDQTSNLMALQECMRQMIVQDYYVAAPAVSAAVATVSGMTNIGNGNVIITPKRGDGRQQENLFAEVGHVTVTGDGQNGTAISGSEPFQFKGDQAPATDLADDWPGASGATTSFVTVNSQLAGAPTLVTGGHFDVFTVANIPDGWTITTGAAGTHVFSEGTTKYRGANALRFVGDGATRPVLQQTVTVLKPNRVYIANIWARRDATAPGAGDLIVSLVDGTSTAIDDDEGNIGQIFQELAALSTSAYTAYSGVIVTPKVLPDVVKVQIEASNGANLANTAQIYIDELAIAEATFLYAGGPAVCAFAGSIPWMTGDTFSITTANDHNGASFGASWQRVFDRFFGMRTLGLLLRTTGANLLNDSLIVAS